MVRDVLQAPDAFLYNAAKRVDPQSMPYEEMQRTTEDLVDTMRNSGYIALHARQIGEILDGFAMREWIYGEPSENIIVVFNPLIKPLENSDRIVRDHACLSVEHSKLWKTDTFFASVLLSGINELGQPLEMTLEDDAAVVVRHETDHGIGKLIVPQNGDTRNTFSESLRESIWQERRDYATQSGLPWYDSLDFRIKATN